jgi:hypothetical protein
MVRGQGNIGDTPMPDYFSNLITMTGMRKALDAFKAAHVVMIEGKPWFVFETVIPTPKILADAEVCFSVDRGLLILGRDDIVNARRSKRSLLSLRKMLRWRHIKAAGITDVESLKRRLLKRSPECIDRARDAITRYEATGYVNADEWRHDNWGTHRSGSHLQVEEGPDSMRVSFEGPWGPSVPVLEKVANMMVTFGTPRGLPAPLLEKLREMHPDIEFSSGGQRRAVRRN